MLSLRNEPLDDVGNRIKKRFFDLIVSSLVIIFILSWLVPILALLIKLESRGPIFFTQKRSGKDGKPFNCFKFRSMRVNADADNQQATKNDRRITRIGKFIRKTSLDELPQFFNVLMSDMSIVGPRPEMPFIVNTYTEEQRQRLSVKPGITGVWQISAVRGEPIHANMEYDLFYIEHRSMLLDHIIAVKTVLTAIRGIGAV